SYGFNIETFKIWIFDRWGQLVFQADNIDQGWNGSDLSGSYFVPSGEYPYKVEVQYDKSMDAEIVRGSVTVVR
ncbi:MAG TPA: gliding motility-associated C-terminal domain-containing protein, partial [Sphingobacteriaceae bacterium]|nr:gliding motility-associated C-terminal domain-containing protein [Sphingobacteriaceae bacterium]